MKILAFVISAGLAGIAGILLSSRLGVALSTSGRGLALRVITAVILGGASLTGGYGKIWGAFLGALFIALINNMLIIGRVFGILARNYFGFDTNSCGGIGSMDFKEG